MAELLLVMTKKGCALISCKASSLNWIFFLECEEQYSFLTILPTSGSWQ